jgi:uncharacterized protein (DUF2236 family)
MFQPYFIGSSDRMYAYYLLRKTLQHMKLSRRTRQELRKIMLKFSPDTTKIHLGSVQVRILLNLFYQVLKAAVGLKDTEEANKILRVIKVLEDVPNAPPRST